MTATSKLYRVNVDFENNAEEWWAALAKAYPDHPLLGVGVVQVYLYREAIDALKRLPGWDDGPEFARHPIVIHDQEPTP